MAVRPSFTRHIRQMFRDIDVDHMASNIDLASYEAVKDNSDVIRKSLRGLDNRRVMPPIEAGGPWPEEWISLFERWIAEDFPE